MRTPRFVTLGILSLVLAALLPASSVSASSAGIGVVPQGTQIDRAYANSNSKVTNVFATTQRTSCYRPEDPYFRTLSTNGYTGMSPCPGADTGEDTGAAGPYATQLGSNPGHPASGPMLVKDHSESDLRVDPTNPRHLIGQVKWFVSAEGYNHLNGFYESWDGGTSWPVQGHVPGYEGWTDNTDPVGAFDRFGNFYSLILPYQFFYEADGTHNFQVNTNLEPNPAQPAEVIAAAVRPHGASTASEWITTHNGGPDFVAPYDSKGREPDKQWIGIDTNPDSPFVDNVYAMWVVFTGPFTAQPFVAIAHAKSDGSHSDWSKPISLPQVGGTPQGATYLLPHVTPDGAVYTTLVNESPAHGSFASTIWLDVSRDGGNTWTTTSVVAADIPEPPGRFTNTTFRDGITATFATGNNLVNGHYPLYVAWEDGSTGLDNVLIAASFDGGASWTDPIQVNDNAVPVDEFQPNLAVADNGTVSVAFYDRRLPCAAAGTAEAAAAGLALDTVNPLYGGSLPPYGAMNYCVDASVQFYSPTLAPKGHNIRLTKHSWDPQLNSPHTRCATCTGTFIGDYFGNITSGTTNYSTFVSTYDDSTNPGHYQQQVVATVSIP